MKVCLLGYAQSGKRTLFHLLTGRTVPENRKPSDSVEGQAPVRDPRVDAIAAIARPRKITYAETTFVHVPDIAVGAASREWLEPARRADALCLVVRAFASDAVFHPSGSIDAARDHSSLDTEILLADLELIEKRLERIAKEKRGGQTPAQVLEEKTLHKCREAIEAEKRPGTINLDPHEIDSIRSLSLLTLKPVIWVHNVDESDVRDEGEDPVTIACKTEQEIMDIADPQERAAFLKDLGLTSSGVDRMNRAVYDKLGLMSFYTMGEDEVRAWTIRKGTPAPAAAGKVHTDIERGFIRAEVIKYDDLIAAGSEHAVKEQGKHQVRGKDYVMQDGDICFFRFSV